MAGTAGTAENEEMTSRTRKNLSGAMLETVGGKAKSAPIDQVFFNLDAERFKEFSALLDAPASANAGLERLMAVKTPWRDGPPKA